MTTVQEDITGAFPVISNGWSCISTYFRDLFSAINNRASIFEIGVTIGIGFLSYMLQKWMQQRYLTFISHKEKTSWLQKTLAQVFPLITPCIAFLLLSLAMGISARFTQNVEVYKFFIEVILIWLIGVLVIHTIPDLFVRWVVACTLIPFLIFSTIGLSVPVLSYLDSLGFSLGGIHVSIFLILKGLLLASCLFWLARLFCQGVISFMEDKKMIDVETLDLVQNLFQAILYTTVGFITLDLIGVDLKSLAIIGGAIGIGIGLGAQKIIANFISGLILLLEKNVKVGHVIEIPGSATPGRIRHLGARAAVIDMGDGRELLIPNEELLTKPLIDWTFNDRTVRTDLHIQVSFCSNLERAKEIMLETVLSHPTCSKKLLPSCFLEKFTETGAQFLLQFWVDDLSIGKMDMQNDVLLRIWKRFSEEKIQFPLGVTYQRHL